MSARWVRVCRVDELEPDRPVGRVVGDTDRDRVCVIRHDGRLMAMLDRCPHRDIALSGGVVAGDELVCPGHFWRFALSTGCRTDQSATRLELYPTRMVDGWVEAQIPVAQPARSVRETLLGAARRPTQR